MTSFLQTGVFTTTYIDELDRTINELSNPTRKTTKNTSQMLEEFSNIKKIYLDPSVLLVQYQMLADWASSRTYPALMCTPDVLQHFYDAKCKRSLENSMVGN